MRSGKTSNQSPVDTVDRLSEIRTEWTVARHRRKPGTDLFYALWRPEL